MTQNILNMKKHIVDIKTSAAKKPFQGWIKRLAANRQYALGADHQIVDALIKDVEEARETLSDIESRYNLQVEVDLPGLYKYSETQYAITKTKEFLSGLLRQRVGTQQNTTECLEHLSTCYSAIEALRHISLQHTT